ncbi:MAG: hypothetical protein WBP81_05265 [Solirubrobacteraceae bacterium]
MADDPTAALRPPGPDEPPCPYKREAVKSGAPSAATLLAPIKAQVACPSTIRTDGNPSYGDLQTIGYRHTVCNMSALPNPATRTTTSPSSPSASTTAPPGSAASSS